MDTRRDICSDVRHDLLNFYFMRKSQARDMHALNATHIERRA